jgi:DegV family protein with EDD domain
MIALVTDSSAYLRREDAGELGARVVPMVYMVDGMRYFESYGDDNGDFEGLLYSGRQYTTSQPNIASYLASFEEARAGGSEVLCVTISSRLSGAYATAHAAARQTEGVTVLDSRLTAGGLYLLLREGRRLIDAGLDMPEVTAELIKARERVKITFSVDDLGPLRRSGRLAFVRRGAGTILNLRPILHCRDGAVVLGGMARGGRETMRALAKPPDGAREAIINYLGESRAAAGLYHMIKDANPEIELKLRKVGPVLGIHLGLRVMAVSAL